MPATTAASMGEPTTSLAATAEQRKQRLLALRKRKAGETVEGEEEASEAPITLKARNFDPVTRQPIKRSRAATDGETDEGVPWSAGATVEKRVEGLAEGIMKQDEQRRAEDLDLLNIAPKRANWDLKRDMERRMKKLERRTVECYAILFRQRLLAMKTQKGYGEGNGDLLAGIAERQKEVEDMTNHEAEDTDEEE